MTGGGRNNVWDSENRLVSCVNGSNTCSYAYGADGIRHQSIVNGVTTDFVLDNSMFVREMRNVNSTETNIATYLLGPHGPEYRRDDANGGTVRWYVYDGLGSVVEEVDPSGNITASRKYDVYGSVRTSTGTSTSKHKFVGSLGHPSEDETSLIYMQARYMDPLTGRFANEDFNKNGVNWFVYCNNDPVNRYDPDGKVDILAILGMAFAAGAAFYAWLAGGAGILDAIALMLHAITYAIIAVGMFYADFSGLSLDKKAIFSAITWVGGKMGENLMKELLAAQLTNASQLGKIPGASAAFSMQILAYGLSCTAALLLCDELPN